MIEEKLLTVKINTSFRNDYSYLSDRCNWLREHKIQYREHEIIDAYFVKYEMLILITESDLIMFKLKFGEL